MRTAEILIALSLMGLSIFFMAYAAELPIGWEPETGPGGGAFPFWLGAAMLVASGVILVRELLSARHVWRRAAATDEGGGPAPEGHTPGAETDAPFFEPGALYDVGVVTGALLLTIASIAFVGVYVAIPLFMLFYLRVIGGHGWLLTGLMAGLTPIFLFFFFEVTLKIVLPKGATEPLFTPLNQLFLQI